MIFLSKRWMYFLFKGVYPLCGSGAEIFFKKAGEVMRLYTTARCGDAHRTAAVFQKLASLIQSQSAKIIIRRKLCTLFKNRGKI